jgi:hypothetical protein
MTFVLILLIHGVKEFSVIFGGLHLFEQEFHTLDRVHGLEHLSQEPDTIDVIPVQKELLFSRSRALNVDGRKDPPVHQSTV